MNPQEIIQAIIKKTGKTQEQINEEIKKEYEIIKSIDLPEEEKKSMAVRRLIASYRKVMSSRAEVFEGVFIGGTGRMNMVARRRAEAIKLFNENKEKAISRGVTDEKGNPLFHENPAKFKELPKWAKEQRFEKSEKGMLEDKNGSKWIGKAMPEEDWSRTLFGAIKKDDKYLKTQVRLRGENTEATVPFFALLKFNGFALQSSTEELTKINDSGELNVKVIKQLSDNESKSLLDGMFKGLSIKIKDIDEWVEAHQEFMDFAIFDNVTITEISPNKTQTGSQIIRIEDDTSEWFDKEGNVIPPVLCFVPPEVEIDFPEKAIVTVIGKPNVGEKGKRIGVLGIFTKTAFKNLVPKTENIESEPEKEKSEKKW